MSIAATEGAPAPPISLGALYGAFLKASLCSVGGGLLVWTRRVLVEERRWVTDAEFADTLSLCQFLPGANFANLSVCVGSRFRGAAGAAAAFLGLALVPLILALLLGVGYLQVAHLAVVRRVLGGAAGAAAGMVIGTGLRMLLPLRHRPAALLFAALAFAGIALGALPLPLVLLALTPFSILLNRPSGAAAR
ncbi:MAG TPA: chromate transporter [Stellaceae bacterium]|jgi:chromate transporter|nr:chromate transporter [Stellaceae bacterium]